MVEAYKLLTHDLRSPVQGGAPVFDGALPFVLPTVRVDESDADCGAGWNACRDGATAFRIAGLWPDGRPSRLFLLGDPVAPVIERADKIRAASWTVVREATEAEVREAIHALSAPFGDLRDAMVAEQVAWRHALARPKRDAAVVAAGLREALGARSLNWELREYQEAWAAREAWEAWAAREAWAAWAAWTAREAREAREAWAAREAREAWEAWAALTVFYAASRGWIDLRPDRLTVGLRTAYEHGLGVALPVADGVLGWAMDGVAPGSR